MRNYKLEGIILKRRNVGEADRILTIFTKKYGKIQAKAIGVRRIMSRRSSHVEPLNLVHLTFYKGRGMPIITEADTIEDFSEIKSDLKKVGFAYHVCELIHSLCPENQENNAIFFLLFDTLVQLAAKDNFSDTIHHFEISLLTHLGFYSRQLQNSDFNASSFIERILERKLKTRQFLPLFQ